MSEIEIKEKCPDCGAELVVEWVTDDLRERVCPDCGKVVSENNMVFEEQSAIEADGEYEVME